jgi:hypothetical protein
MWHKLITPLLALTAIDEDIRAPELLNFQTGW